jgi:hypothetical protein
MAIPNLGGTHPKGRNVLKIRIIKSMVPAGGGHAAENPPLEEKNQKTYGTDTDPTNGELILD